MYNTDAKILKQVCYLIKNIIRKYQLADEDIFQIVTTTTILIKLANQIEKEQQSNEKL